MLRPAHESITLEEENFDIAESDILEPLHQILGDVALFRSGEHHGPYAAQAQEAEKMSAMHINSLVWDNGLLHRRTVFIENVAGLILQGPVMDQEDEERHVQELVDSSLGQCANDGALSCLPKSALATIEIMRELRQFTDKIITPLNTGSLSDEYELMKKLCEPCAHTNSSKEKSRIHALQLIYFFNLLDKERATASPKIGEKLKDGEFDTFIAQEVLDDAIRQPEGSTDTSLAAPQRLLKLATRLAVQPQSIDDIIAKLSDQESLSLWGAESKRILELRRAYYIQTFLANYQEVTQYLGRNYYIIPDSSEADVSKAGSDLVLEFLQRKSTNTYISKSERLEASQGVENEKRKRARTAISSLARAVTASAATQEVATRQSRKLVFIKPNGEIAEEDSPECEAVFDDYYKSHRGQPGLIEDLKLVKAYLKNIDLSGGLPRGIYKMNGAEKIQRGITRLNKVYQLRPSTAVGLPTASEASVKLRVYFTLINSTGAVGILGIGDKDNVGALQRSLGVRGRAHRR